MIRANLVVLTLALAAAASTSSFASPRLPKMHHQPPASQPDTRITVRLFNPNIVAREVKVDGRVYAIQPHETLSIKAPAGTNVYAANDGRLHQKGEVLFPVIPQLQDKTLSINSVN
jgi:murein DD-endopeptidase MepM/ murein hydrolase activator NlpD